MNGLVDACVGEREVNGVGQRANARFKETLQPGTDHVERQVEYEPHDEDKHGDGGPLAGEDAIDGLAALALLALLGFDDARVADVENEREAHVGDGGARV